MKTKSITKRRRIFSWTIHIGVTAAVLFGITVFQSRHLLSEDTAAPEFELVTLDGLEISLADHMGKKVVLYFGSSKESVGKKQLLDENLRLPFIG